MNWYLDCETTGLDSETSKIITIQLQPLDTTTGNPIGPLQILKEWESNEGEILREFSQLATNYNPFGFCPIGYNLQFEHQFILTRCEANGLEPVDILKRPFLDFHAFGVLMNGGLFKGSGLDRLTNKPSCGVQVPFWYKNKEYQKIENYIKLENLEFIKFITRLYRELPEILRKMRNGE